MNEKFGDEKENLYDNYFLQTFATKTIDHRQIYKV